MLNEARSNWCAANSTVTPQNFPDLQATQARPVDETDLLNRPERKWFPGFQAGIPVVKKVKLTIVTGTGERYPFAES
jgi:hypothetical protein